VFVYSQITASIEENGSNDVKLPDDLTAKVVRNLTVSPGMKLVLSNNVSPALLQPHFTIIVGKDELGETEVRVLTDAFIGSPPMGPPDPSKKYTPFRVRAITSNLLLEPAGNVCNTLQYAACATKRTVSICYAVRRLLCLPLTCSCPAGVLA
jgi:hypothetical protein